MHRYIVMNRHILFNVAVEKSNCLRFNNAYNEYPKVTLATIDHL